MWCDTRQCFCEEKGKKKKQKKIIFFSSTVLKDLLTMLIMDYRILAGIVLLLLHSINCSAYIKEEEMKGKCTKFKLKNLLSSVWTQKFNYFLRKWFIRRLFICIYANIKLCLSQQAMITCSIITCNWNYFICTRTHTRVALQNWCSNHFFLITDALQRQ